MDSSRIPIYVARGAGDKLWYAHHKALFIELFGAANLHLVTQLFAATSINSSLKSNIRLFRKAYHEITHGLPFTNYLPNILLQLERIRAGEPIQGNKINAFAAAMFGDENAVVVDTWLLRAFDEDRQYIRAATGDRGALLRSSGATDKQFSMIEAWVREQAQHFQSTPAQLSAMIWSGVRNTFSNERATRYDEILRHQEFNMFK